MNKFARLVDTKAMIIFGPGYQYEIDMGNVDVYALTPIPAISGSATYLPQSRP